MAYLSHLPANTLLQHGSGLRALARGLLADEHAAEDVAQDTWVKALERPPQHVGGFSGWLRQVATSIALKRRRGEGRRSAREREASREESLAGADDVIAQRELLKLVVDGIMQLDERYQRVVLLRYYQDLSPRQIAARLDLPVATVESQLHRARVKLRGWLEAQTGDRDSWVRALAVLSGWQADAALAAGSTTLATGGLSMYWKLIAATTAAAAALIQFAPEALPAGGASTPLAEEEPELAVATPAQQSLQAAAAADDDERESTSERVAVEPRSARHVRPQDAAAEPYRYHVSGTVVDAFERPLVGAEVFIAPAGQPLNRWGRTGADGSFSLTWTAAVPQMSAVVRATGNGGTRAPMQVSLRAAQDTHLRLQVDPHPSRKALVKAKDSLQTRRDQIDLTLPDRLVEIRDLERRIMDYEVSLEVSFQRARHFSESTPQVLRSDDDAELVHFAWGPADSIVAPTAMPDMRLPLLAQQDLSYERALDVSMLRREIGFVSAEVTEEPDKEAEPQYSIRGTVTDAAGEPLPGAPLFIEREGEVFVASADDEGAFHVRFPDAAGARVRVGGGEHGVAERTFAFDDETRNHSWDALLDRGREVAGRVIGEADEDLSTWVVEWQRAGSDVWTKRVDVARDGSFAIPGLPAGPGTLALRRVDQTFAVKLVPGVYADSQGIELVLGAADRALESARVKLVDAGGEGVHGAEVRVWPANSARGAWMSRSGEKDGVYALEQLPAGPYRATVVHPAFGTHELGSFSIRADTPLELGTVRLQDEGQIRASFQHSETQADVQWAISRRDGTVGSFVTSASVARGIEGALPAGEYVLQLSGPSFFAPALAFSIGAGDTTSVEVDLTAYRPVELKFSGPSGHGTFSFHLSSGANELLECADLESAVQTLDLAPGDYRVSATSASGASGEAEFTVGAGDETNEVTIDLAQ